MELETQRDVVASWLVVMARDRYWLAEQLGASKSTVDSWFSKRPFPKPMWKRIVELMDESTGFSDSAILNVTFTLEEFEMLERARISAGFDNRVEFYREAIMAFTQAIAAKAERAADQPLRPENASNPN